MLLRCSSYLKRHLDALLHSLDVGNMNCLRDVAAHLLGLIEARRHILRLRDGHGHGLVAADLLGLLISVKKEGLALRFLKFAR